MSKLTAPPVNELKFEVERLQRESDHWKKMCGEERRKADLSVRQAMSRIATLEADLTRCRTENLASIHEEAENDGLRAQVKRMEDEVKRLRIRGDMMVKRGGDSYPSSPSSNRPATADGSSVSPGRFAFHAKAERLARDLNETEKMLLTNMWMNVEGAS